MKKVLKVFEVIWSIVTLCVLVWMFFAYMFPQYFAKFNQIMDYGVFLRALDNDMVYSVETTESAYYYDVVLKGVDGKGGDSFEKITYRVETAFDNGFALKRAEANEVEIIEHEGALSGLRGFLNSLFGRICIAVIIGMGIFIVYYKVCELKEKKTAVGTLVTATNGEEGDAEYAENASTTNVRFSDVAGLDEEIVELEEVVDFLKFPEKYTKLGAKVPKGVLMYGKPGTGKTLLAKAVAGEAGVNFIEVSGSEFVNKYVGVGADNIRKLFKDARDRAPCIIFIDEIDAIGGKRDEDSNSERKQSIDELLTQMDGFKERNDIVILAATNSLDQLDAALTRPGRFDRIIHIGMPDVRGRESILKVHSRNKPLMDDVNLHEVAKRTAGFSGADLANLMNEAAIHAARKNQEVITNADVSEAFKKVTVGLAKANRVISEKEKKITATHEAGHAVVSMFMHTQPKVKEVSIVPHGRAGGYTMHDTDEDKSYISKDEFTERLAVLMAGRAAEQIFIGDISTGASNDIEVATKIAGNMISIYGMSKSLGPVSIKAADNGDIQLLSLDKLNEAGDEIVKLIQEAEEKATEIINQNRKMHEELVQMLLEEEEVSGDELLELYNKHVLAANTK